MPDEIKTLKADSTLKGQDLLKEEESNSIKPTKSYTEKELRKAVEDAIAQYGDRIKTERIDPVTRERDTFKSQLNQLQKEKDEATASVQDREARIAELEADLETAYEGNTDMAEIAKIKKDLRAEKVKLQGEVKADKDATAELKKTLEKEREEWASLVAESQADKFAADVFELVSEYDGETAELALKLKAACDKAGIKTKEGAQGLADVLWVKKTAKAEEKEPALIVDSGVTSGGTGKLTLERIEKMSPEEYANHPETKARYNR